jgi:hypothetical protein
MRYGWILMGLAGLAGWHVASSTGWYVALNDWIARPPVALVRDDGDVRVLLKPPSRPAFPHEAQITSAIGIPFGTRYGFRLPEGAQVTCWHRFQSLTCDGGWQAERSRS